MADKDFILISKRKVQRLLELYTLEGRTQEEAAQIALKGQDTKGLSQAALGRRVLHYLGLNMNYRKDYLHEGLTPEIIGLILSNRILAFPLMIPLKEILPPVMNFDAELYNILNGGGKGLKALSAFKDGLVVALLLFLTYAFSNTYNSALTGALAVGVPILLFLGMPFVYRGDGDRFNLGDFIFTIIVIALFAITFVFQHR